MKTVLGEKKPKRVKNVILTVAKSEKIRQKKGLTSGNSNHTRINLRNKMSY